MEWKDEAIEAALSAYWDVDWSGACKQELYRARIAYMRMALNAAIKAQGVDLVAIHQSGRADALEEAAKTFDKWKTLDIWRSEAAATCRELKDKK